MLQERIRRRSPTAKERLLEGVNATDGVTDVNERLSNNYQEATATILRGVKATTPDKYETATATMLHQNFTVAPNLHDRAGPRYVGT